MRAFYLLLIAALLSLSACAHGYRTEKVTLVSDGLKVNNLVYYPGDVEPGRKYPGLIFCHGGYKGVEFSTRGWARELARKGFVVVLPQFRGQGGSQGRFEFAGGEVADAAAALTFLEGLPSVDRVRTGVVGYSLGGLVALRLAEESPKLKAVVLISAISDPVGYFEAFWAGKPPAAALGYANRHKRDALERSPLANLAAISAPVLIVHGESDHTVDPGQSRRLYQLLRSSGKEATLKLYPGVTHEIMWFWAPREDVTSYLLERLEQ